MGIANTFKITGTALSAESIHMDAIARNMANAQVVSGTERQAFRAQRPVFATILESSFKNGSLMTQLQGNRNTEGVRVSRFTPSSAPVERQYMPENPMANSDGYVFLSNVDTVEEMVYMMQASRNYQSNIEVLNTSKQLMLRTLSLGSR